MNLSTAKSVTRASEIAMKKTLGSSKSALAASFLAESVFLSLLSLVLAIGLVQIVIRATSFNTLIGKELTLDYFGNPVLLIGSILIAVGIGIISGLYPAFYLPRVNTITALKGAFKNRKSSHTLRRVLITIQFVISIFVVVSTLFMREQIAFMREKDLGFDKDNIVLLPVQDSLVVAQMDGIKNEFLRYPGIKKATTAYNVMGIDIGGSVMWAESTEGMKQQAFSLMFVGEDYLKTMDMQLVSGRDFYQGKDKDIQNVFIANESAAKLMGWGDKAVGKKVKFFHGKEDGEVIGLVKDFNYNSLHKAIEPMLIIKVSDGGGFLHLKVAGEDLPATMAYIQKRWTEFDPNHPFEYSFLDQRFNEQYHEDEVQYKLLSGLSYICIFISLLGLLGLSAFSAAQRTKEIGIRKVHGASTPSIIYLLFKDVMVLVIIAAVLVVPVVYYIIEYWMRNFAYKTDLNYMLFFIVGLLALLFAFLTVAFHSLKTARTNPVDSLKYE
jgi:putative ABC transport system permease protein